MTSFVAISEDASNHLAKARQNFALYSKLKTEGAHLDWAITVLFYTVLHLVQAYACQYGPWTPTDHSERARFINQELRPIFYPYRDLQDRSRNTRYDLDEPTAEEVQAWEDGEFRRIVEYLAAGGRGIRLFRRSG